MEQGEEPPVRPSSPNSGHPFGPHQQVDMLSSIISFLVLGLTALPVIGLLILLAASFRVLLSFLFGSGRSRVKVIEMREVFGPERTFSVMVPAHWLNKSDEEYFHISASESGPSLTGMVWRIDSQISFRQFADARFSGVADMKFFKQVGKEFQLENGSVARSYAGFWPGDRKMTSYTVVCLAAEGIAVTLSLMTARRDYRANSLFYRSLLSSLRVQPASASPASASDERPLEPKPTPPPHAC